MTRCAVSPIETTVFMSCETTKRPNTAFCLPNWQDRGAHLVCCDERFLPGISLEKGHRYLLCEPGQDADSMIFDFLKRNIATPVLSEWKEPIISALEDNKQRQLYAIKPLTDKRRLKPYRRQSALSQPTKSLQPKRVTTRSLPG